MTEVDPAFNTLFKAVLLAVGWSGIQGRVEGSDLAEWSCADCGCGADTEWPLEWDFQLGYYPDFWTFVYGRWSSELGFYGYPSPYNYKLSLSGRFTGEKPANALITLCTITMTCPEQNEIVSALLRLRKPDNSVDEYDIKSYLYAGNIVVQIPVNTNYGGTDDFGSLYIEATNVFHITDLRFDVFAP